MAAQSAATTARTNLGALNLFVFTFTSVATGDTFISGLTSIFHSWAITNSITTQASAGIVISRSGGTYTLKPGEDSNSVTLFVLAND